MIPKAKGGQGFVKNTFILLSLLVTMFSYSVVQAESFTLISSSFLIDGRLSGTDIGASGNNISESYHADSLKPISNAVTALDSHAMSGASYDNVYMDSANSSWYGYGYDSGGFIRASAYATATLDFQPNFSGEGTIKFTIENGQDPGHHSLTRISLTDINTSIVLLSINGPYWQDSNYVYLTLLPFTYNEWDHGHDYRLIMEAGSAELNHVHETAYAEITTDMAFNNIPVPEPSSIILFITGLAGITWLRRSFSI